MEHENLNKPQAANSDLGAVIFWFFRALDLRNSNYLKYFTFSLVVPK